MKIVIPVTYTCQLSKTRYTSINVKPKTSVNGQTVSSTANAQEMYENTSDCNKIVINCMNVQSSFHFQEMGYGN